jgi:hypothetical protein
VKRKERIKHIEVVADPSRLRKVLKTVAVILIIFGALAFFTAVYKHQTSSAGIYRMEYEGRIVDKSETFAESRTGSRVSRRLLIEAKDGSRFEVAVNKELYDRVQKGMWIKSSGQGVELSWP